MKILHFSDIHIGGWVKSLRGYFDKRLIGAVNYTLRRHRHIRWHHFDNCLEVIKDEKPDVVCFTGDIVSISDIFEFRKVREKMRALVEDESFELLCVPGNHDRYINNKKALKLLDETYNYLNRGKFDLADFPIKTTIGDLDFYLIDESAVMPLASSNGIAKLEDIAKITEWVENKKRSNILVGHYPLKSAEAQELAKNRNLKNSQKIYCLLENKGIDVALCGHTHFPFIRQEKSGALEICAGSLTINGRVNKLTYQKEKNKFKQEWIIC